MKVLIVLLGTAILGLTACSHIEEKKKPTIYILDDGLTGWVRVNYNQASAPELPLQKSFVVARIPKERQLATKSRMNPSWDGSVFFYQTADGNLVSLATEGAKVQRIWGRDKTSDANGEFEEFFVGDEGQISRQMKATHFSGTGMNMTPAPQPEK